MRQWYFQLTFSALTIFVPFLLVFGFQQFMLSSRAIDMIHFPGEEATQICFSSFGQGRRPLACLGKHKRVLLENSRHCRGRVGYLRQLCVLLAGSLTKFPSATSSFLSRKNLSHRFRWDRASTSGIHKKGPVVQYLLSKPPLPETQVTIDDVI
ncbi:hypothetical protein C8Q69DRAFT_50512 [Paecilomyces variotii]|uniref:Uncharacterized protein n=1 Tax=Byssochlamys spectabilis TaxID=264951 RepID=A0A443I7X4_BYSSP|nr:hypothetical protein C8Q69DRAFT_50512 [Paecilomyces variotii]RWR00201.1 hypothetical protein C8Q69DRAFT_50512 [Paecilomyces variotii]